MVAQDFGGAVSLTGICGDLLTTQGAPSECVWPRAKASSRRMNFSDNILIDSIVDQRVEAALDLFRECFVERAN